MVQPRQIPRNVSPPAPPEPPPAPTPAEQGEEGGVNGGEQGGVVGGVVGGQKGGTGPSVEDTPSYATAGYRKPELAARGCLQGALVIPREMQRSISGPVTIKFAIQKDGTPTSFQIVGQVDDARIADVIWRAVTSCKWIPGADPNGNPASIWVVVPFRFETG